jgi:hypothetical protein
MQASLYYETGMKVKLKSHLSSQERKLCYEYKVLTLPAHMHRIISDPVRVPTLP